MSESKVSPRARSPKKAGSIRTGERIYGESALSIIGTGVLVFAQFCPTILWGMIGRPEGRMDMEGRVYSVPSLDAAFFSLY